MMPVIIGNRHRRKARHTSVTDSASRVYSVLLTNGFIPHPGVITPKGGKGGLRITVTHEPGRVRITVNGAGSQELLIYGAVDRTKLHTVLQSCGPRLLTERYAISRGHHGQVSTTACRNQRIGTEDSKLDG